MIGALRFVESIEVNRASGPLPSLKEYRLREIERVAKQLAAQAGVRYSIEMVRQAHHKIIAA